METVDNSRLKKTPLCDRHIALGAKMAPFGGWLMPIQYEGIIAEHHHTRTGVTVFDICHMGEFMLEADAAASGFDRVVTQKIVSMPLGSCRYGFMLNELGGVIDDLIVYRLEEKLWMIVVNAATIDGDEANLRAGLSGRFTFENHSTALGKLDVQGPRSLDVMTDIFGRDVAELKYYTLGGFDLWGEKCIISCTGYTGELGYEVYISSRNVGKLWDVLLKDSRVKPAGLGCRDTLRLEKAFPLYGHELDAGHTPLEAGLEKFVDFSKDFIGKTALLEQQKQGVNKHLICFKADSRRSPRNGFAILRDGTRVGIVTSGSFSPSLSCGIGMGYVDGPAETGAKLTIRDAATEIPVTVVKKPFYHKPL